MKLDLIQDIEGFRSLKPEWNGLAARSFFDNPFLTFEWYEAWLEVFGNQGEVTIVAVRQEGRLIALAPLFLQRDKTLTFIGYPQNDYAGFIIDRDYPEAAALLASFVGQLKGKWKLAVFDQISEQDDSFELLSKEFQNQGLSFRVEPADKCPAMTLEDPEAARKMYYKRNITSYVNWLKKEGDFRYNIYTDRDEALSRLDDLFNQHIKRWEGTPTPSYFRNPSMTEFYRRVVEKMHPCGWIHFSSLTLDSHFLALYISLEYGNKLYFYKTCFNLDYAKKSPGQVILRYHLDYALSRGIVELDFARGDEGYKDRFANRVRQSRRLIIYPGGWRQKAAQVFYDFRYSKLVDILYRNRYAQQLKDWVLAKRRKR